MANEEHGALDLVGLRFQIGIFEEALRISPGDADILRFLSHAYATVGQLEDGLAADRTLAALLPDDPRVRYNLACSCALTGQLEEAIDALQAACDLGFDDLTLMRGDQDLDALRGSARFKRIEAKMGKKKP